MHPALIATLAPLARLSIPWAVAGGWAIDLALERVTRPHGDVDVAVFRDDQDALRATFPDWTFEVVVDGRLEPWPRECRIELPIHEIHARAPRPDVPPLELLLNEREGREWLFRRDPAIRRPLARALIVSPSGIPILAPEIVLLYKSKNPRPTDELDFASAIPLLDDDARSWLRRALDRGRAHPWARRLDGTRL